MQHEEITWSAATRSVKSALHFVASGWSIVSRCGHMYITGLWRPRRRHLSRRDLLCATYRVNKAVSRAPEEPLSMIVEPILSMAISMQAK